MKTILITGGAGFIGNHLCRYLLEKGGRVICLDNLFSSKRENIKDLLKSKKFTFTKHNIVRPFKPTYKIDEIYNLACIASPVGYQSRPLETLLVNSIGVKNILDLALKNGARFLQTSTSEVYGDPAVHPQKESYWGNVNPNGIRSCYDEGKRFAESLIFTYHRLYKLDVKVVRIFNTYGPKMHPRDGRVISNFLWQALRNKPLTIYGTGRQTRSFCYVSDMVRGLVSMMRSRESGPVNLGNPGEFTILELAKSIIGLTGSKSALSFSALPGDDPVRRCPDISLAKRVLGWEPIVSLEEGLRLSQPYFKSVLSRKFLS